MLTFLHKNFLSQKNYMDLHIFTWQVRVNHLHLQAQTLYTYNFIGYNLFFILTQGRVNALGHVSVDIICC
jgi:hypothetical protein